MWGRGRWGQRVGLLPDDTYEVRDARIDPRLQTEDRDVLERVGSTSQPDRFDWISSSGRPGLELGASPAVMDKPSTPILNTVMPPGFHLMDRDGLASSSESESYSLTDQRLFRASHGGSHAVGHIRGFGGPARAPGSFGAQPFNSDSPSPQPQADAAVEAGAARPEDGDDEETAPYGAVPTSLEEWSDRIDMVKVITRCDRTEVWEGVDRLHDVPVAVKFARRGARTDEMETEAAALTNFDHPNIVRMLLACTLDEIPRIVMELADTTLLDALTSDEYDLDENTLRSMMAQAADAFTYIHDMGYVHGDIKPDNMLLYGDQLKVSDFGLLAAQGTSRNGIPRGTEPYMAPELIEIAIGITERRVAAREVYHRVECAADVWSFAIVLYSVLLCDLPWDLAGVYDDSYNWFINDPTIRTHEPWALLAGPLLDLMLAMLTADPSQRPTMEEVAVNIRGPWLLSAGPEPEPEPEFESEEDEPDAQAAAAQWGSMNAAAAQFGESMATVPYAFCRLDEHGQWVMGAAPSMAMSGMYPQQAEYPNDSAQYGSGGYGGPRHT